MKDWFKKIDVESTEVLIQQATTNDDGNCLIVSFWTDKAYVKVTVGDINTEEERIEAFNNIDADFIKEVLPMIEF